MLSVPHVRVCFMKNLVSWRRNTVKMLSVIWKIMQMKVIKSRLQLLLALWHLPFVLYLTDKRTLVPVGIWYPVVWPLTRIHASIRLPTWSKKHCLFREWGLIDLRAKRPTFNLWNSVLYIHVLFILIICCVICFKQWDKFAQSFVDFINFIN